MEGDDARYRVAATRVKRFSEVSPFGGYVNEQVLETLGADLFYLTRGAAVTHPMIHVFHGWVVAQLEYEREAGRGPRR